MEPCLFRHGKAAGGAGRSRAGAEASMEPCLFRHGKVYLAHHRTTNEPQLQWSHVFSDMVREREASNSPPLSLASMEPCLFRHGKA
mgnify:FL=1